MKRILLSVLLLVINVSLIFPQVVGKKAGVCFRTDDDQPIENYQEYASLFNQYNQNFTCAINFGKDQMTQEYIDMLKQLQLDGHEVMDHTPWHSTKWFSTKLGTDYYINHPGVETIYGNNIRLKHAPVNTAYAKRNGSADVNGNIVSSEYPIFSGYSKNDCYLYFPALDQLVFIDNKDGWIDNYHVKVENFWGKDIDLGIHNDLQFYNFDQYNIHVTLDAVKALAEETLRITEHYNIGRPYSWIQPGGYHPYIHKNELMQALSGELGFRSGGIFPDPSIKVFNEFNPNNDKQFGMNFGDFRDDIWTLEKCKEVIADRAAKHQISIGLSHFAWTDLLGGWDGFLERTEGIIQWCIEEGIPIRTYDEWADILYNSKPDPYENIFPRLYIDKDHNGTPDGYLKNTEGLLDAADGAADISNCSYSISRSGNICTVEGLGGVEKGENEFIIWTKGSPGNFIEVDFKIGTDHIVFKFPAETSEWTKFSEKQSINGNTSLFIPENISTIDVTVKCSEYSSGKVKISGISLMKKGFSIDLKVFLQGGYSGSGEISTMINSAIPRSHPYSKYPWRYSGDERIYGDLNTDIVDWVLVSLTDKITDPGIAVRKAALLRKDGKIMDLNGVDPVEFKVLPGQYYVRVEHRNHLSIISAEKIRIGEY